MRQVGPSLVLKGNRAITAVAVSAVSGMSAFALGDGTIIIDASHHRAGSVTNHNAPALCLAFSPDGGTLASGHIDGTVCIWDVGSSEARRIWLVFESAVSALAFSPDGRNLVCGGGLPRERGGEVAVCALGPEPFQRLLPPQPFGVGAVCFGDDKTVLIGGLRNLDLDNGGQVVVWDNDVQQELRTLVGHRREPHTISFSPMASLLAVGSLREVRLWRLPSGEQYGALPHSDWVHSVAFCMAGRMLATGTGDGNVSIWDVPSHTLCRTYKGHRSPVGAVTFVDGDNHVAAADLGGGMKLWNAAKSA